MLEGINVLSLFDGMSCGQIALKKAGINVKQYYASEIDTHAIKVTQHNHPKTIQLGSVTEICDMFCDMFLPKIDLLIGGSPCQGFSFAGKQLNFEDPRSKLFFEFVRLKEELNPAYFLLENVKMKKEYQDIISTYLGVEPIEINSALVSAQSRKRLYWTNIPGISQPEDRGLVLKDILENGETDRDKAHCIDACYYKGGDLNQYFNKSRRQVVFETKPILMGRSNSSQDGKIVSPEGKSYCHTAGNNNTPKVALTALPIRGNIPFRKLTPLECERLQTVPDNYSNVVSNSQRYKMLGNGWTVDVIAHIFKNLPYGK